MAQTNYWKVGLFVALGLALAVGTLGWLGAAYFEREARYAVTYLDESAEGLEFGAPVKVRGVTIGSVTGIGIAPDAMRVEVRMDIYVDAVRNLGFTSFGSADHLDGPFVPSNMRIRLASTGITGIKFLELDFVADDAPRPELSFDPPWEYVPAERSTLKSFEQQGMRMLEAVPEVLAAARDVLKQVDGKLQQIDVPRLHQDVQEMLGEARSALRSFDALTQRLDGEVRDLDPSAMGVELARILDDLSQVTAQMAEWSKEDGAMTRAVEEIAGLGTDLRQVLRQSEVAATAAALRGAAQSVGVAGDHVGPVGDELSESLRALRETLDAVRALAARIERDPGILLRGNSGGRP